MHHTSDKWEVEPKQLAIPALYIIAKSPAGVPHDIAKLELSGACDELTKANARRIVACVNACHGVPIEALEQGWTARELNKYAATMTEHRHAALEALKGVVRVADRKTDEFNCARIVINQIENYDENT